MGNIELTKQEQQEAQVIINDTNQRCLTAFQSKFMQLFGTDLQLNGRVEGISIFLSVVLKKNDPRIEGISKYYAELLEQISYPEIKFSISFV